MSETERADAAEAETRRLADDLCSRAHGRGESDPSERHCQECYGLASEVLDTPWAASRDARLAAVEALGQDGSPGSLMETIRRTLVGEAGIWPDRANLATSLVMRDIRAALHSDPSEATT